MKLQINLENFTMIKFNKDGLETIKIEEIEWIEEIEKIYKDCIPEIKKNWCDENQNLILAQNNEDYRNVFIKDFGDAFTEEFQERYFLNYEFVTAEELRKSCDFSKEINGEYVSIEEGHELFESNFQSWVHNCISEEWDDNNQIVKMEPEDSGEIFHMTIEEYEKI